MCEYRAGYAPEAIARVLDAESPLRVHVINKQRLIQATKLKECSQPNKRAAAVEIGAAHRLGARWRTYPLPSPTRALMEPMRQASARIEQQGPDATRLLSRSLSLPKAAKQSLDTSRLWLAILVKQQHELGSGTCFRSQAHAAIDSSSQAEINVAAMYR